jgi:hypothetical protein
MTKRSMVTLSAVTSNPIPESGPGGLTIVSRVGSGDSVSVLKHFPSVVLNPRSVIDLSTWTDSVYVPGHTTTVSPAAAAATAAPMVV